jgi:16S rRNA (adenine1518-N6/adenine1519-N6)-dimethyltransferase
LRERNGTILSTAAGFRYSTGVAQTKRQIESLLAEAGSHPRHQFGQNFMIDQNLVRLVADAGNIDPDDCVIEVGPGTGTLTEELLERAGKLIVVEIDRNLAAMLRQRLGSNPKFQLIEGDALAGKHHLNAELATAIQSAQRPVKLVANLPYNIASPLVIEMLIAGVQVLAFTVQKEVADRFAGKPGTSEYGPLTVMAQLLGRVEILRTLPPQAFWPAPKIESSLVRLVRDDRLGASTRPFGQFVHALFSFRRKTLRRGLIQAGIEADAALSTTGFDGTRRAEEFSPEELLALFRATTTASSG